MSVIIKTNDPTATDRFTLSFDGENEIGAGLLGIALSNTAYVMDEIIKDDPGIEKHKLTVSAFKKGSFVVDFTCLLFFASQASGISTLSDVLAVVNSFKGVLEIKKLLKGERPKEVIDREDGTIDVFAPNGSELHGIPGGTKVFFHNPKIDQKMTELAEAVRLHNPSGGFSLESGDDRAYFDSEDVQDIAIPMQSTEFAPSERYQTSRVRLPIRKPDLLGNASWTFQFVQRDISAKIVDQEFIKQVNAGRIGIAAGDKLDVDLTIKTNYSGDGVPLSESYAIDKVYGHVPSARTEQQGV